MGESIERSELARAWDYLDRALLNLEEEYNEYRIPKIHPHSQFACTLPGENH
jgi:hypothetical protein